jgi:hypothetical protein
MEKVDLLGESNFFKKWVRKCKSTSPPCAFLSRYSSENRRLSVRHMAMHETVRLDRGGSCDESKIPNVDQHAPSFSTRDGGRNGVGSGLEAWLWFDRRVPIRTLTLPIPADSRWAVRSSSNRSEAVGS